MEPCHCFLFQATGFSFHDNHGKDIVLSDNMQTAERMSDGYNGIVVSRDYMAENRVYEVDESVMA